MEGRKHAWYEQQPWHETLGLYLGAQNDGDKVSSKAMYLLSLVVQKRYHLYSCMCIFLKVFLHLW